MHVPPEYTIFLRPISFLSPCSLPLTCHPLTILLFSFNIIFFLSLLTLALYNCIENINKHHILSSISCFSSYMTSFSSTSDAFLFSNYTLRSPLTLNLSTLHDLLLNLSMPSSSQITLHLFFFPLSLLQSDLPNISHYILSNFLPPSFSFPSSLSHFPPYFFFLSPTIRL